MLTRRATVAYQRRRRAREQIPRGKGRRRAVGSIFAGNSWSIGYMALCTLAVTSRGNTKLLAWEKHLSWRLRIFTYVGKPGGRPSSLCSSTRNSVCELDSYHNLCDPMSQPRRRIGMWKPSNEKCHFEQTATATLLSSRLLLPVPS